MKISKVAWKVERLEKMFRTKKVNFDLVIQRKDNIWDLKRKSTLIHSILTGYPIPALFATKESNIYHFLDGKQRFMGIHEYVSDGYSLHEDTPPLNGVNIAGLRFDELTTEMKNTIMNYEIDITKIENVTPQEMEELFFRLNNGVPLRQIETTRAILGNKRLKFVEDIASMVFFTDKVNLSSKARNRYTDQELVLQILTLINNNETGFSGKELQLFVQELKKTEIRDELKSKMQNACYYLNEAFPKKAKFLKKLHVPILFKLVLDVQSRAILLTPKEFGAWAESFFSNMPTEYAEACSSGSARKENVQKRLHVMTSHFNEFLEIPREKVSTNSNNEVIESDELKEYEDLRKEIKDAVKNPSKNEQAV